MRYILSLVFLISFSVNAQFIILFDEVTEAVADTVPSQFTFADVTNAGLESYNTAYVVLTGFDSCYASAGTDSFKVGVLGTLDVATQLVSNGDTVYLTLVASDICSTAITSTLTAGGISNEWSVTTTVDNTPTQFAIHDSTDAAVSTQIISNAVVPAGFICDAPISVAGGDYRIGALGSITRTSGIIELGDTVFVVDTSSATNEVTTNVALTIGTIIDTFSVTTVAAGSAAYITDSLKLYYDDDSLSNGAVSSWAGVVGNILSQGNAGFQANMTDTGCVFINGDEFVRNGTVGFAIDSIFTMELVAQISDTTTNDKILFSVRQTSPYAIETTIGIHQGELFIYAGPNDADGRTIFDTDRFVIYPIKAKMAHIVMTSDGNKNIKVYYNGAEQTETANTTISGGATTGINIGVNEEQCPPAGTVIRLARFYNYEFDATDVGTNYNSDSVQNKNIE